MKSIEWIEKAREKQGNCSYYRIAQELNLSRQAISNHKTGRRNYLEDDTCLLIAKILEISAESVIGDQHAEQAKTIEEKQFWLRLAATAATVTICLAVNGQTLSHQILNSEVIHQFCILC